MALTTQDRMLIEQRVSNDAKSVLVAYILWFFAGLAGAHRFYLGRGLSGLILLLCSLFGFILAAAGIGIVLLIISGLWLLWDLIAIPGMAERHKAKLRDKLAEELSGNA